MTILFSKEIQSYKITKTYQSNSGTKEMSSLLTVNMSSKLFPGRLYQKSPNLKFIALMDVELKELKIAKGK